MKKEILKTIVAALGLLAFTYTGYAVSDDTWGEAWNSKIGKAKFTVTASINGYNATPWGRGNCACMFDNANSTSFDYLEYKSNFPVWVKLVIADNYESGKDVILKKYRVIAGSTARAPKTWKIYGANSADVTWDETDKMTLIDSRENLSGVTSADYDCSGNALSYRVYFFYFVANNGDGLLQIPELYLFGEVKEHEEKIGYSVSTPYASAYDGYSHGITVTPTYPESGVTVEYSADNANWQTNSPRYKAIGEYTIYYRLSATDFPTETGSRTISITTPPQQDVDITAAILAAEKYSGATYHNATAVGHESFGTGASAFVNGVVAGERNGWAGGSGYLTYEIPETYRPGDTITVKSIALSMDKSYAYDGSTLCMPRNWKFEAYDAANDAWVELAKYENNTYPEWTAEDIVKIGGKDCYQRTETFTAPIASRKYRFTVISGRTHLGELTLNGDIIMADISKIHCLSSDYSANYDGAAHGISVTVQNPDENYTISYRALPAGEWTTTNPQFVGPIPASEAQQVEWKIEADGFDTVAGTNSVVLAYPDLTALLRDLGSEYYGVSASGNFGTTALFVDGNEDQRNGWVNGGTFTYVVSNAYETGKAIVLKGIGFAQTYGNADSNFANMPRYFLLEGWNDDVQQWTTIVDRRTNPLPEWTEDDNSGGVYRKKLDIANDYGYRAYRLTLPNRRQHTAEISLYGYAAASAPKQIFYTASDYVAAYDGEKRGISVAVTTPASGATIEYSLDGSTGWLSVPYTTKGIVSEPCTIYWRISAPGYKTITGSNVIQITDQPHVDTDITALVRGAEKTEYAVWTENGTFATSAYNFINGSTTDRNGWVSPKTGTGLFCISISNSFRKGEAIIVKGVAFAGSKGSNIVIDSGNIVLPKVWFIEGSLDGENWARIATYDADNYPAWSADDIVGSNYYRRTDFDNTTAYRLYRLGFTGSRTHISEIYLYGDVGQNRAERPPRRPGGFSVIIR